jgi:hypothetical protein
MERWSQVTIDSQACLANSQDSQELLRLTYGYGKCTSAGVDVWRVAPLAADVADLGSGQHGTRASGFARGLNGHRETGRQAGVTRETINALEKGRFHPNLRLAFKSPARLGSK